MTSAPMEKEVAYGVFMPVGEGGWIHSTTAPPVPATYAYNHQYVHLEDCISNPKPLQKPHPPIICAGNSDTGLRFIVEEA
jgi:alkanesulfonate monooxygenase SsuD/methylene tetrahydromethanopterin reductase-like flavin-dependent oxidoreductase (luciferase family)